MAIPAALPFPDQRRPPGPRAARHRRSAHRALLSLPAQTCRVREARHFAGTVLGRWHLPEDSLDSALLIVGELAANAAQHGRGEMTLALSLDDGVLDIMVTDYDFGTAPLAPEAATAGDDVRDRDERGRGLHIVRALADWSDIHRSEQQTRVRTGLCIPASA